MSEEQRERQDGNLIVCGLAMRYGWNLLGYVLNCRLSRHCVACEMRPKMAAAAVGDLLAAATAASSEPTSAATHSTPLDWPRTRCTSAGRGAKRQWWVERMSGRATGLAIMDCQSHAL